MRINFFEEFPDENSLSKAKQINFPSTIFLAAKSLKKYDEHRQVLHSYNKNLDTVFWPILEKSYWFSHFSFPHEIEELIQDILTYKARRSLKVMLDLEVPVIRPAVLLHAFSNFSKSRVALLKLFKLLTEYKISIFTAEYLFTYLTLKPFWNRLGVSHDQLSFPHIVVPMAYTSNRLDRFFFGNLLKTIKSGHIKELTKYVAIGTIAKGIFGHEPILSVTDLDHNLHDLRSVGVENVVVFRMGGLNSSYLSVIQKYT